MKLFLTILLIVSLLPVPGLNAQEAQPLKIVALNFPAYDFSRQVAGSLAQVSLLLPPGADAHSFEPSPKDLIALQQADLLVYNGGIGEHWVKELLNSMGNKAPLAIAMMDVVATVQEELVEGMEDAPHAHGHDGDNAHDHENEDDHEHDERELDEHVWTTPANAIEISRAIAKALISLDPAHEEQYNQNFWDFEGKLEDLDVQFRNLVAGAKRRTIVLGDRFPMRYFTKEYGLSYYAAFPGCAAQTEPTAKTIAFLLDAVKKEGIPVVFYIEFSNQKAAKVIAAETRAKPLLLHSAHNVSQQELDAGISYLSIMEQNLANLKEALN